MATATVWRWRKSPAGAAAQRAEPPQPRRARAAARLADANALPSRNAPCRSRRRGARRRRRIAAPARGRPRRRVAARHASCTGCCRRCPTFRPSVAPRRRGAISRARRTCSDAERDAIAREVLALLDDPRFAPLFAPASAPKCRSSARLARRGRRVVRPDRPAGGHADDGADRRLQDRPRRAAAASRTSRRGYVAPARALPGVLRQLYPDRAGPRRPDLDRRRRHLMEFRPRSTLRSQRWPPLTLARERALTLPDGVHTFPAHPRARRRPRFETR